MLLPLFLGQGTAGVVHSTSGVLTPSTAAVAGTSARTRQHVVNGVLTGQGATVVGAAARTPLVITHDTNGVLAGQNTNVAGVANRTRQHAASGALSGQESILAGSAARTLLHATTGVLASQNAIIVGIALRGGEEQLQRGEGWIPQVKRKRKWSEERDEREQLRKIIEQAVDPVTEKEAKVVNVKGEVAVVTESKAIPIPVPPQFDPPAVAKMVVSVLEAKKIEVQRARDAQARRQARIALEAMRRKIIKRRREEEILLLM